MTTKPMIVILKAAILSVVVGTIVFFMSLIIALMLRFGTPVLSSFIMPLTGWNFETTMIWGLTFTGVIVSFILFHRFFSAKI